MRASRRNSDNKLNDLLAKHDFNYYATKCLLGEKKVITLKNNLPPELKDILPLGHKKFIYYEDELSLRRDVSLAIAIQDKYRNIIDYSCVFLRNVILVSRRGEELCRLYSNVLNYEEIINEKLGINSKLT